MIKDLVKEIDGKRLKENWEEMNETRKKLEPPDGEMKKMQEMYNKARFYLASNAYLKNITWKLKGFGKLSPELLKEIKDFLEYEKKRDAKQVMVIADEILYHATLKDKSRKEQIQPIFAELGIQSYFEKIQSMTHYNFTEDELMENLRKSRKLYFDLIEKDEEVQQFIELLKTEEIGEVENVNKLSSILLENKEKPLEILLVTEYIFSQLDEMRKAKLVMLIIRVKENGFDLNQILGSSYYMFEVLNRAEIREKDWYKELVEIALEFQKDA